MRCPTSPPIAHARLSHLFGEIAPEADSTLSLASSIEGLRENEKVGLPPSRAELAQDKRDAQTNFV
jgi:hypothetical protein